MILSFCSGISLSHTSGPCDSTELGTDLLSLCSIMVYCGHCLPAALQHTWGNRFSTGQLLWLCSEFDFDLVSSYEWIRISTPSLTFFLCPWLWGGGCGFIPTWFVLHVDVHMSSPPTSIPANTAVFQSTVMFAFILSVPILRERVTVLKV